MFIVPQFGTGACFNVEIVLIGIIRCTLDGSAANKFIVTAKADGDAGITLFVVDADAAGVSIERTPMMDSRNAITLTLENVKVAAADILGEQGNGQVALEKALDIARIGLPAEMLGSMMEAYDRTIAYLKERQQFGVPIGVFQGLQHRAADMYCEIENCKSLVIKSLQAIDSDSKGLAVYASMTKAKVSQVLKRVTNEAIQMFGGIGMTDDESLAIPGAKRTGADGGVVAAALVRVRAADNGIVEGVRPGRIHADVVALDDVVRRLRALDTDIVDIG